MSEEKSIVEAPQKPDSPSGGASALLQAHKEATGNGRGPGSRGPRGPYRKTRDRIATGQSSATQTVVAQAPASNLFTPENTARLVALPFTLAAVSTNYDGWNLDETERKELAAVGSSTLNEWVSIDPKWVSLCLFSLSLIGIATAKAIEYQGELRAKQILKPKPAPQPAAPAPAPKDSVIPMPSEDKPIATGPEIDFTPKTGEMGPLVPPPAGFGIPPTPPQV